MTATRALAGIALVAGALTAALAPTTAHAATAQAATGTTTAAAQAEAPSTWGVYYAPGRAAKAYGTLQVGPRRELRDPTPYVKVNGTVVDSTRSSTTCGLAVFRISYDDGNGGVPHTLRTFTTCRYGQPKRFAFEFKNVYQVELKVCAEPRAKEPSLNCLYAGSWKSLWDYLKK